MTPSLLISGAVIFVSLTSIYILVIRDWRYCIAALVIQYVGVFILVLVSWPVELALVKLFTGFIAGVILVFAMTSVSESWRDYNLSIKFGLVFRLSSAALILLAISSLVLGSESWLSIIDVPLRWGSLILISMGLLQLSLTSHPLTVITGLLTALSGFEIIYAAIETSVLVAGLLSVVTLGLALVGAYFIIGPTMDISQ